MLSACSFDSPGDQRDPGSVERRPTRVAQASAALEGLPRADPRPDLPRYARDAFGPTWADVDDNGCNQRDDVLLRDVRQGTVQVATQGSCDHDVLAGTWMDPYTGVALTFDDLKDPAQAQAVQIDHVVPLAEAWQSGAASWPEEQRLLFANDLPSLLAVDGPTNAEKGDADPAQWQPPPAQRCAYAVRWIDVKDRWGLGVDDAERTALGEMLQSCEA